MSGRPENWQAGVYILLLTVLAVMHKKMPDFWKKQWIMAALCVLLFRAEGDLRITMLDVGQGDCIHIRSDSGRHYLIDGGSSTKNEVAEYQILPYLKSRGVSRLEAVFVTHSDIDHCNGIISLLEKGKENRLDIGSLILPDVEEKCRDEQYHRMEELAAEQGIPVQYMSSGEFLEDEGLRLTCVHPSKGYEADTANEYSLVLYLTYGKFTALFTGDAEGAGERAAWQKAAEDKKELTLLKVAHHGSSYSTGEELLSELSPAYALISCGKNNRYGHPHKELLERLEAAGCRSYLTTESGAVTVRTDGERCVVECFK